MELAERMVQYRAEQNITQRELARRCKLTNQTVCNIENGKAKPTALTRAKIERVISK